jgi:hypothetical protein
VSDETQMECLATISKAMTDSGMQGACVLFDRRTDWLVIHSLDCDIISLDGTMLRYARHQQPSRELNLPPHIIKQLYDFSDEAARLVRNLERAMAIDSPPANS